MSSVKSEIIFKSSSGKIFSTLCAIQSFSGDFTNYTNNFDNRSRETLIVPLGKSSPVVSMSIVFFDVDAQTKEELDNTLIIPRDINFDNMYSFKNSVPEFVKKFNQNKEKVECTVKYFVDKELQGFNVFYFFKMLYCKDISEASNQIITFDLSGVNCDSDDEIINNMSVTGIIKMYGGEQ